jgi:hypothetical protein
VGLRISSSGLSVFPVWHTVTRRMEEFTTWFRRKQQGQSHSKNEGGIKPNRHSDDCNFSEKSSRRAHFEEERADLENRSLSRCDQHLKSQSTSGGLKPSRSYWQPLILLLLMSVSACSGGELPSPNSTHIDVLHTKHACHTRKLTAHISFC